MSGRSPDDDGVRTLSGSADDTTAALLSTVASLWPSAEVGLSRCRRRDPTAQAEFALIPHRRRPRLLAPVVPTAAARSLLRFSSATSAREAAGRIGGAVALRAAGTTVLPDRIVVRGADSDSFAAHLSSVLGRPVTFSIGIGTPRVNRKPVLQVFDDNGRTVAFVKLGDSAMARSDVTAEGRSLAEVSAVDWRTLIVPRVLHQDTWRDMTVLVLSPLTTSPRQRPSRQWEIPIGAMDELTEAFGEEARTLATLPWLARHRTVAQDLAEASASDRLLSGIDRLVTLHGHRTLRVGAWHGDWTPWNMARSADRTLLWDWERFEKQVPAGLDACHYAVNATTRRHGTTPDTIRAGLAMAGARPDHPSSEEHLRGALYLLAVLGRYLPLTEVERGDDIAPRAQQVLETFGAWLTHP